MKKKMINGGAKALIATAMGTGGAVGGSIGGPAGATIGSAVGGIIASTTVLVIMLRS